jgi:DNA-binding LacI/PurR family transcriptional regulator
LLEEMGVPIVLVNNQNPGTYVHAVMIGNVEGSRAATKHLIDMGHKRIAYIGDQSGFQSDTERFAGYRAALSASRIPFKQELIGHGDGKAEAAIAAMNRLLQLSDLPTAVCCYNDMTALGAIHAIHSHGLRVPEDVSVTGFDDLFFASYTQPPLTTVRQPMHRMGELAMESLLRLMSGGKMVGTVRVDPELIVRKSTASPRNANNANGPARRFKRR